MKLAEKLRVTADSYFDEQKKLHGKINKVNFPVLVEKLYELITKAANKGNKSLVVSKLALAKIVSSYGNIEWLDHLLFIEYSTKELEAKLNSDGFTLVNEPDEFTVIW